MGKQPYELSVWRDIPIAGIYNGEDVPITDGYFTDEKVAIIGSDSMDSPLKAYDVSLKELTNGDCTLTFSMLYDYEKDGKRVNNPLFELLKNEIKLKLRRGEEYGFINSKGEIDFTILNGEIDFNEEEPNYEDTSVDYDNRWRDFVIKTIDKDSNTHVANIVAKEIFVNELGKNGWSVTLNTELENNYGTVERLAEKVLDGSDWKVEKSYSPIERVKEPLFEYKIPEGTSIAAVAMRKGDDGINKKIDISANEYIYFFYNDAEFSESEESGKDGQWGIKAKESVQILYFGRKIDDKDNPVAIDDGRVVIDDDYLFNYKIASAAVNVEVTGYSGYRIQDRTRTEYESTLDKYVEVYTNGSEKYFSYTETEYHVSPLVQNYLTNSTNFTSNAGWKNLNKEQEDPVLTLYPEPTIGKDENGRDKVIWENSRNSLVLKAGQTYVNSGPANAGFKVIDGEKYIVRFSGDWLNDSLEASSGTISFSIKDRDNEEYFSSINEEIGFVSREGDTDYIYCQLDITKSSNSKQSLVLTVSAAGANFYLYDIQLFAYQLDEKTGNLIFPGDAPTSTIEDKRYFYKVENGKAVYYDGSNFKPLHEDGYHSVRFFETQESNYFNNLQSLAELFEVWVSFHIKHKKNGQIWLESKYDENGKFIGRYPVKTVKFSQYSPNSAENHAGFKYGINLKGIKRTVDSNSIASKVIVKPNNQEYAIDGMCTIARAPSNQTGETEIINFDYYINQGLISYGQVINDLYGTGATDLRYFAKLKNLNKQINEEATYVNAYSNTVSELEGQYDLYNAEILAYDNEISELTSYLNNLNVNDEKRTQYANEIARLEILRNVALQNRDAIEKKENGTVKGTLSKYQGLIDVVEERIKNLQKEKEDLKLKFYTKYSRFIQEGTWTDESYVDDELYYLDAVKISNTSAYPQVSYTINVLSVEDVDGYEAYKFNVGDRTYIEDVEFFGYVIKEFNGMSAKTPYRMEVIVSERNQNLDDASKTTITIKNYKNQFEELFQKITATTQSLQYQVGEYARAAGVVTPTGELKVSTLEQSFQNNSLILSGSDNQSVIWDTGTGIEVIDNRSSNNRVRVVGGGVFISNDGGVTWSNAISGNGINTKYLIAGQIDASKINLVNGNIPYFRWDTKGISAFRIDDNNSLAITYDMNRFVRFNQYGLYAVGPGGIKGEDSIPGLDFDQALEGTFKDDSGKERTRTFNEKLEFIENNASFSLTWKGLSITGGTGEWQAVKLDAEQGLRLLNSGYTFTKENLDLIPDDFKKYGTGDGTFYQAGNEIPILAIGQFPDIKEKPIYGIRLRNSDGFITFMTDNRGEIWATDRLFIGPWNDKTSATSTTGLNARTITLDELNSINNSQFIAELSENPNLVEHSIRIWAGAPHDKIELSPFLVLENGTVIASNAYISGNIQATSGNISGLLTIGNGRHGIDGSSEANPIIWSKDENGIYKFWIDSDGILHAEGAEISGTIGAEKTTVKKLLIPDEKSGGIDSTGNVRIWINEETENDRETSIFYVTEEGHLHTKEAYLDGNLYITKNEDGSYQSGVSNSITNDIILYAGAQNNDRTSAVFTVDKSGNVIAKSLNLGEGILTAADAELSGTLKIGTITIDGTNGIIHTANSSSVAGWSIDQDGNAQFNNINARGEITSAIFSYNSVNTMGGNLYLAPVYYDYENTAKFNDRLFTIEVDEITYERDIWTNDSNIEFSFIGDNIEYNNIKGKLTKQEGNKFIINPELSGTTTFEDFTVISNFSISLTTGCGINLDAGARNGPAIIITDLGAGGKIAAQLGSLKGVSDAVFGQLDGYGLYSDRAYLSGRLYLPGAGITNETIQYEPNAVYIDEELIDNPDNYIRMWAGAEPDKKANAPFVVTEDGSLYATKGKFNGVIEAVNSTFSGWLQTAGILIDTNEVIISAPKQKEEISPEEFIENKYISLEDFNRLNGDIKLINNIEVKTGFKIYYIEYTAISLNDILAYDGFKTIVEKEEIERLNPDIDFTTNIATNTEIKIGRDILVIKPGLTDYESLGTIDKSIYQSYFNNNEEPPTGDTPDKSIVPYQYITEIVEIPINTISIKDIIRDYGFEDLNDFNKINKKYDESTKQYKDYTGDEEFTESLIIRTKENIEKNKNSLHISYDRKYKDNFPQQEDKILQIDKNGLSIWEGGFNIYSDYASGWRDFDFSPTGIIENYYGYSNININPFPYIKAIDDKNYRLYTTSLNIGKFTAESGKNKIENFIKINDGKISFIQYNNDDEKGEFLKLESQVYNTLSDWSIFNDKGLLTIGTQKNEDEFSKLVTFEKNNDEVILGVQGELKVNNKINTLNYIDFSGTEDNEEEIITNIVKYIGTKSFDRGIDFNI